MFEKILIIIVFAIFLYVTVYFASGVLSIYIQDPREAQYSSHIILLFPIVSISVTVATGYYIVKKIISPMIKEGVKENRSIRIIGFALIVMGIFLVSSYIINDQLRDNPSFGNWENNTQEEKGMEILGMIISLSWYVPFFVIGFYFIKKSRKIKNITKS